MRLISTLSILPETGNFRQTEPPTFDRDPIADHALDRYQNSHQCLQHVRCHWRASTLRLTGTVPTYYMKQVAQELVRNLKGVDRIVNDLQVEDLK